MGYQRVMGYGPNFPVNQLGGSKFLWVFIEYGLLGIWVRRVSTFRGSRWYFMALALAVGTVP